MRVETNQLALGHGIREHDAALPRLGTLQVADRDCVARGQKLEQQSRDRRAVAGKPQLCGKLYRPGEVALDRSGERWLVDLDDPLIALRIRAGIDGNREAGVANEIRQRRRLAEIVESSETAQRTGAGRLDHEQADGALVSVRLQGERAVELDGPGEQGRRPHAFAQQAAKRLRIVPPVQHAPPGGIEMHDLAADPHSFEEKAVQRVTADARRFPIPEHRATIA